MLCVSFKHGGCRIAAIHDAHAPLAVFIGRDAIRLIRIAVQLEDYGRALNRLALLVGHNTRNGHCIHVPAPHRAIRHTARIRCAVAVRILRGLADQLRTSYRLIDLHGILACREAGIFVVAVRNYGLLANLRAVAVQQCDNCTQYRVAIAAGYAAGYCDIVVDINNRVRCIDVVTGHRAALNEFQHIGAGREGIEAIAGASTELRNLLDNLCADIVQDTAVVTIRLAAADGVRSIAAGHDRLVLLISYGYHVVCVDLTIAVHGDAIIACLHDLQGVIAAAIGQGSSDRRTCRIIAVYLVEHYGCTALRCAVDREIAADRVVVKRRVLIVRITSRQILGFTVYGNNLDTIGLAALDCERIEAVLIRIGHIYDVTALRKDLDKCACLAAGLIQHYASDRGGADIALTVEILGSCRVCAGCKVIIRDCEMQDTRSAARIAEHGDVIACADALGAPMAVSAGHSLSDQSIIVGCIDVDIHALYWVGSMLPVIGEVDHAIYYTRLGQVRLRIRLLARIGFRAGFDLCIDLFDDIRPSGICSADAEGQAICLRVAVIIGISAVRIIEDDIYQISTTFEGIEAVCARFIRRGHPDILRICSSIRDLVQQDYAACRYYRAGAVVRPVSLVICVAGCGIPVQVAVRLCVTVDDQVNIILIAEVELYAYAAGIGIIAVLIGCTHGDEALRDIADLVFTIFIGHSRANRRISVGFLVVEVSGHRYIGQPELIARIVQIPDSTAYIIVGVLDRGCRLIRLLEVVGLRIAVCQQCIQLRRIHGDRVHIGFALGLMDKDIIPSVGSIGRKRSIFLFIAGSRDLNGITVGFAVNEQLHKHVYALNSVPAPDQLAQRVILIVRFAHIIPIYRAGDISCLRGMRQGDIQPGAVGSGCIAVRDSDHFDRIHDRFAAVIHVLCFPLHRPATIRAAAGQGDRIARRLAICKKLHGDALRTQAITVAVVIPQDISVYIACLLIAGQRGFPLVLSGEIIQTAVDRAPLGRADPVERIRIYQCAIVRWGSGVVVVNQLIARRIRPAERISNRDRCADSTPYWEICDGACPAIAVTGQRDFARLGAVAVDLHGDCIRPRGIVIVSIVPVDREVKADALRHGDRRVIIMVCCGLGVLGNVFDLCCPYYRISIEICRQITENIRPRGTIAADRIGLRQVDGVVFDAIGEQCNVYAGRIRTITPRIAVIQPAQVHSEILRAGTNVIQIIFVRQRNIKADAVGNGVPRGNAGGIGCCGIEDLVRYAVIDCVLRQSLNGVRPARGAVRTPFRYRYAADFISLGVRHLAGLAIDRVGADNRSAGVAADNDCQAVRPIAALIVGVKPIDMAGLGAGIAAAGKGNNDLVVIAVRLRQLYVTGGRYRVIRRAVVRR